MPPINDAVDNDKSGNNNKITFDSTYYSSRRIPVKRHRREIGKVFAEVKKSMNI